MIKVELRVNHTNAQEGHVPSWTFEDRKWFLNHPNKHWYIRDIRKDELESLLDIGGEVGKEESYELVRIHEATDPSEGLRLKALVTIFEPRVAYLLVMGRDKHQDYARLIKRPEGGFKPVRAEVIARKIREEADRNRREKHGEEAGYTYCCEECGGLFQSGELVFGMPGEGGRIDQNFHRSCFKKTKGGTSLVVPGVHLAPIYRCLGPQFAPKSVIKRVAMSTLFMEEIEKRTENRQITGLPINGITRFEF